MSILNLTDILAKRNHLDRKLSEKRIFPAIDINKSGTRREDLLLTKPEMETVYALRKALNNLHI